MEDPYLSNLLAARPASQTAPTVFREQSQGLSLPLIDSLRPGSWPGISGKSGEGRKRGMNVTRGDWRGG